MDIIAEIATACERLGAPMELLCALGGYGDTVTDADVLAELRAYNAGQETFEFVVADIHGREDKMH